MGVLYEIRIDGQIVSLRNEHGTTHARLSAGPIVPVMGVPRLENLTTGTSFETVYADEITDLNVSATETFIADLESADGTGPGSGHTQTVK